MIPQIQLLIDQVVPIVQNQSSVSFAIGVASGFVTNRIEEKYKEIKEQNEFKKFIAKHSDLNKNQQQAQTKEESIVEQKEAIQQADKRQGQSENLDKVSKETGLEEQPRLNQIGQLSQEIEQVEGRQQAKDAQNTQETTAQTQPSADIPQIPSEKTESKTTNGQKNTEQSQDSDYDYTYGR